MRNFVTFLVILSFALAAPACSEGDNRDATIAKTAAEPQTRNSESRKSSSKEPDLVDTLLALEDSVTSEMEEALQDSGDFQDPFVDEFSEDGAYEADPNEEWTGEDTEDSENGDLNTDYFSDEDVVVEKERMVYTGVIRVLRPDYIDERDSTLAEIEKRLTITPEKVPRTLIVEKWMSPINYRGYKFNRKKLMLYGVDKDRPVAVFFYLQQYYCALGKDIFELDETASHTPFESVSDTALVRHLRAYDNSL